MNTDPISSELAATKLKPDGDKCEIGCVDVQDKKQSGRVKLGTVRTKMVVQISS